MLRQRSAPAAAVLRPYQHRRPGSAPGSLRQSNPAAMKAVARLALLSALAWAHARGWTLRGRRARQGARVARRHEALLFARTSAKHRASAQSGARMVEQMKLVHKTAYWGQML